MGFRMQAAPLAEMNQVMLYRMLQLRTEVFVVEQQCAYPELDGRDLEPNSLMVWAESDDEQNPQVIATLRVLRDGPSEDGLESSAGHDDEPTCRIGRVAAHPDHRGTGLARAIFQFGLDQCAAAAPELAIVLDAQEPLEGWYESFGFARTGPTYLEDDIPHVPMRREP